MKNTKFKEITLMNAFLCIAVVMIHITSEPVNTLTAGSLWHFIFFVINRGLCFCVPSFIFLSGFKLHNKFAEKKIDINKFYIGRLKKIVLPYVIWVLIYFIYFNSKNWVNICQLPEYILLGTVAAHFYYIVIAVQAYLLFPLLNKIFEKRSGLITAVAMVCTVCFAEFMSFKYSDRFIGTYIFYFVLGMYFSKYKLGEKSEKLCVVGIIGFLITAVVHIGMMYLSTMGVCTYSFAGVINVIYVTFAIMAMYGIFILVSRKYNIIDKLAQSISNSSFDIYLYHCLIISILQYDIYVLYDLTIKTKFIITFVTVFSIIFIYCLIKRIFSFKGSRK